jgi:HEAT repeat protein
MYSVDWEVALPLLEEVERDGDKRPQTEVVLKGTTQLVVKEGNDDDLKKALESLWSEFQYSDKRYFVVDALGSSSSPLVLPFLHRAMLESRDENLCRRAARRLSEFGTKEARDVLISITASDNKVAKTQVMWELSDFRSVEGKVATLKMLDDPDVDIRKLAISLLPRFGDPEIVLALEAKFNDPDEGVREQAKSAVKALRDEK